MQNISFSIVIPLYNKVQSIKRTLDCVINQTCHNFEVIVVNDGSTDGSETIAAQYEDNRVRLINKENGGVSSARNRGIEESKYKYIALLDADDYWEPTYIEEQVKMISDFPNAMMCGMGWGYLENNNKKIIPHFTDDNNFRGYIDNFWTKPKKSNIFWASAVVINKDVFNKIEMFDERISRGEDLDVWWRIILNFEVAFNSKTLSYYRQDAENRAMDRAMQRGKGLIYYRNKYEKYLNNNDFRLFFDNYCISSIHQLLLSKEFAKEVKPIAKTINLSGQKISNKMKILSPRLFHFMYLSMQWLKQI